MARFTPDSKIGVVVALLAAIFSVCMPVNGIIEDNIIVNGAFSKDFESWELAGDLSGVGISQYYDSPVWGGNVAVLSSRNATYLWQSPSYTGSYNKIYFSFWLANLSPLRSDPTNYFRAIVNSEQVLELVNHEPFSFQQYNFSLNMPKEETFQVLFEAYQSDSSQWELWDVIFDMILEEGNQVGEYWSQTTTVTNLPAFILDSTGGTGSNGPSGGIGSIGPLGGTGNNGPSDGTGGNGPSGFPDSCNIHKKWRNKSGY